MYVRVLRIRHEDAKFSRFLFSRAQYTRENFPLYGILLFQAPLLFQSTLIVLITFTYSVFPCTSFVSYWNIVQLEPTLRLFSFWADQTPVAFYGIATLSHSTLSPILGFIVYIT